MASEKRLAVLEKMVAGGSSDSFVLYGLALEYVGFDRTDDAVAAFAKLREQDSNYVPAYLMCGQLLGKVNRTSEAREWLTVGLEKARANHNEHAASEIESALASLPA